MLSILESILNRFGHKIVAMEAIVVIVDCPRFDYELGCKITQVIVDHHEQPKEDNVIPLHPHNTF